MKKMIALLLALALVVCLAACGSSSTPSSGGSDDSASASTSDAEESTGGGDSTYNGESFTIYMASNDNENSDQNAPMVYFRDLVAEKSGGKVTVEVSWGGTEYDNSGIWEAMQNNLLNMDIMLMNKHSADAPLMAWGYMPYSQDAQEAIDQTNYMLFENETTSKIIADYFDSYNMTILGNSCDGAPAFITTFDWDTLDELVEKCSAFGTMNTAKYMALGLNCVAVPATDTYDNMSRGIIDGSSNSLPSAVSISMYEVGPYACVDGQYMSAVAIVVNNDFWNGLSDEAQALIQECVDATSAFSGEHVTQATIDAAVTWEEETGNAVKYLSEEDGKDLWALTLAATAENAKQSASGQPYEDDMKTLLEEWIAYQEDYQGITVDWSW